MKTKKAFTMIELIFIIVIIGILAAISIPKLAATRDDAKVVNCLQSVTMFMRDVSTYYTAQGEYAIDIKEMSNVEVHETTSITKLGDVGEYYFICDKTGVAPNPINAAITFKFSKVNDGLGNIRTNLNAVVSSLVKGTVDGDLGILLKIKNIATDGLGIDHPITGIRVKK